MFYLFDYKKHYVEYKYINIMSSNQYGGLDKADKAELAREKKSFNAKCKKNPSSGECRIKRDVICTLNHEDHICKTHCPAHMRSHKGCHAKKGRIYRLVK